MLFVIHHDTLGRPADFKPNEQGHEESLRKLSTELSFSLCSARVYIGEMAVPSHVVGTRPLYIYRLSTIKNEKPSEYTEEKW